MRTTRTSSQSSERQSYLFLFPEYQIFSFRCHVQVTTSDVLSVSLLVSLVVVTVVCFGFLLIRFFGFSFILPTQSFSCFRLLFVSRVLFLFRECLGIHLKIDITISLSLNLIPPLFLFFVTKLLFLEMSSRERQKFIKYLSFARVHFY